MHTNLRIQSNSVNTSQSGSFLNSNSSSPSELEERTDHVRKRKFSELENSIEPSSSKKSRKSTSHLTAEMRNPVTRVLSDEELTDIDTVLEDAVIATLQKAQANREIPQDKSSEEEVAETTETSTQRTRKKRQVAHQKPKGKTKESAKVRSSKTNNKGKAVQKRKKNNDDDNFAVRIRNNPKNTTARNSPRLALNQQKNKNEPTLIDRIKALTKELEVQAKELNDLKQYNKEIQEEKTTILDSYKSLEAEHLECAQAVTAHCQELGKTYREVDQEKEKTRQKHEDLNFALRQVTNLLSQNAQLNQDKAQTELKLQAITKNFNDVFENIQMNTRQNSQLSSENQRLKQENLTVNTENQQLKQGNMTLNTENQQLIQHLKSTSQKISELSHLQALFPPSIQSYPNF